MELNKDCLCGIMDTVGTDCYIGSLVETSNGMIPTAVCVPGISSEMLAELRDVLYPFEDENHESRVIIVYDSEDVLIEDKFGWREVSDVNVCIN